MPAAQQLASRIRESTMGKPNCLPHDNERCDTASKENACPRSTCIRQPPRRPRNTSRAHDFGPGRSKLFGNSADEYLKAHNRGPSQADVTEGSGGIWERLHYDWSDPNHVVLTTTDSNTWGGASATPTPSHVVPMV